MNYITPKLRQNIQAFLKCKWTPNRHLTFPQLVRFTEFTYKILTKKKVSNYADFTVKLSLCGGMTARFPPPPNRMRNEMRGMTVRVRPSVRPSVFPSFQRTALRRESDGRFASESDFVRGKEGGSSRREGGTEGGGLWSLSLSSLSEY